MKIVRDFQISLNNEEILLLLQKDKVKKNRVKDIHQKLMTDIDQMKKNAYKLIKPEAIFDIFKGDIVYPKYLFDKAEKVVLAICTIGKQIEKECSKLLKRGLLAKGVILDAIASHAVEVVAEQLNQKIISEYEKELTEKQFTNRFSPGYCKWSLAEGQELIFKLLPANNIGVKLTNSNMMIPRKSISFAINIGYNVDKNLGVRECKNCNENNCKYRKE